MAFLTLFYVSEINFFKEINKCLLHALRLLCKYDTSNITDVLSSQAVIPKAKEDEKTKRQM